MSASVENPGASNSDNLKKRRVMTEEEEEEFLENLLGNQDSDSDDELPYGGKVYLARRRKPDSWACIGFQVGFFIFIIPLSYEFIEKSK